jgi:hypothetical protein
MTLHAANNRSFIRRLLPVALLFVCPIASRFFFHSLRWAFFTGLALAIAPCTCTCVAPAAQTAAVIGPAPCPRSPKGPQFTIQNT